MRKKLGLVTSAVLLSVSMSSNIFAETFNFDKLADNTAISESNSGFEFINFDGSDIKAIASTEQAHSGSTSLKMIDKSTSTKPYVRKTFAAGDANKGKLSVQIYVPDGNSKSTYVALGKGITAEKGVERYLEVKVSGSGNVSYENGKTDPKIGSVDTDTWNEFVVEWGEGKFNLTVNGEKMGNNLPILNAEILPTSVILYTGDNKNPKNVAYIDDLSSDLF